METTDRDAKHAQTDCGTRCDRRHDGGGGRGFPDRRGCGGQAQPALQPVAAAGALDPAAAAPQVVQGGLRGDRRPGQHPADREGPRRAAPAVPARPRRHRGRGLGRPRIHSGLVPADRDGRASLHHEERGGQLGRLLAGIQEGPRTGRDAQGSAHADDVRARAGAGLQQQAPDQRACRFQGAQAAYPERHRVGSPEVVGGRSHVGARHQAARRAGKGRVRRHDPDRRGDLCVQDRQVHQIRHPHPGRGSTTSRSRWR